MRSGTQFSAPDAARDVLRALPQRKHERDKNQGDITHKKQGPQPGLQALDNDVGFLKA